MALYATNQYQDMSETDVSSMGLKEPKRDRDINRQLMLLDSSTSAVVELAEKVLNRLAPLMQSSPEEPSGENIMKGATTQLGDQLSGQKDRVERVISILNRILSYLEI